MQMSREEVYSDSARLCALVSQKEDREKEISLLNDSWFEKSEELEKLKQ